MVQELDGVLAVTVAFFPEQTLTLRKVIGAIPVNAVSQTGTITEPPGGFADRRPGVT